MPTLPCTSPAKESWQDRYRPSWETAERTSRAQRRPTSSSIGRTGPISTIRSHYPKFETKDEHAWTTCCSLPIGS